MCSLCAAIGDYLYFPCGGLTVCRVPAVAPFSQQLSPAESFDPLVSPHEVSEVETVRLVMSLGVADGVQR